MNQGPRIEPVRATLLSDCSIMVVLTMPGWDEPQITVVEQSTDFLTRVGSTPRPINLEGGDRAHELAREHVARHIRWIERRIKSQQAYQRYEQRTAPVLSATSRTVADGRTATHHTWRLGA